MQNFKGLYVSCDIRIDRSVSFCEGSCEGSSRLNPALTRMLPSSLVVVVDQLHLHLVLEGLVLSVNVDGRSGALVRRSAARLLPLPTPLRLVLGQEVVVGGHARVLLAEVGRVAQGGPLDPHRTSHGGEEAHLLTVDPETPPLLALTAPADRADGNDLNDWLRSTAKTKGWGRACKRSVARFWLQNSGKREKLMAESRKKPHLGLIQRQAVWC